MGRPRKRELSEEEIDRRARARLSAHQDQAEHDLGVFIELHNPDYDAPEHLRPLLDALDRSMREPVYALVEAPPQHGKTETILEACARRLKYRGKQDIAYCSYAAPFALRKSRKAREKAARAGVWMLDEKIIRKNPFDLSTALSYWQTIQGGSFTAGGRNSSFTGDGYDKVVIDDPLKNREEAESPIYQEKAIETVRSTFGNRINPGGSYFITHQPWNKKDPIAQLKAEKQGPDGQTWEVITLPAVIDAKYDEDGHLIGGMPLWPARYSLRDLAKKKYIVGEYNWFSQYTLERRPRGDRIFHEPARYTRPHEGGVVIISVDPGISEERKTKKNAKRDPSGIVVGNCYRLPSPYHTREKPDFELWIDVLFAAEEWRDIPGMLDLIEVMQTSPDYFPGAPCLLEEVSAFKAYSQVAERLNKRARIYAVTPHGNKLLRAQPTARGWNRGRIRVPLNGAWVASFIEECQWFTGREGGTDNRVDALSQLYDYADKLLTAYAEAVSGGEVAMASSPY